MALIAASQVPIKTDIKIIAGIIFSSFAHLQDVADRYSIIFRRRDIAFATEVAAWINLIFRLIDFLFVS